jgi:hypothetical protein
VIWGCDEKTRINYKIIYLKKSTTKRGPSWRPGPSSLIPSVLLLLVEIGALEVALVHEIHRLAGIGSFQVLALVNYP